jgi:hypothetical protein
MMKRTMMISSLCLAGLLLVGPAWAQSQYQSTFELGVGYTRPATENTGMVRSLLQGDDYLVESGIGIRTGGGDTRFSWLVRAGARAFQLGNVRGHVGGEFSLHTNSANNGDTLIGLGFLVGVSHQVADHLNLAVHVYPLAFDFGGTNTITKIGVGELGVHLLF